MCMNRPVEKIEEIKEPNEEIANIFFAEIRLDEFGEWILQQLYKHDIRGPEAFAETRKEYHEKFGKDWELQVSSFKNNIDRLVETGLAQRNIYHSDIWGGAIEYNLTTHGENYKKRSTLRNKLNNIKQQRDEAGKEIIEMEKELQRLPRKIMKKKQDMIQIDFRIERAELEYKQAIEKMDYNRHE